MASTETPARTEQCLSDFSLLKRLVNYNNLKEDEKKRQPFDWHGVLPLVKADTAKVKSQRGKHPLHIVVRINPPFEVVAALLAAYPEAARVQCDKGMNPLHEAALSKAPIEIVAALLQAHEEGAKKKDSTGRLPLHHALENRAPIAVVAALLESFKEGARVKIGSGITGVFQLMAGICVGSKDMKDEATKERLPIQIAVGKYESSEEIIHALLMHDLPICADKDASPDNKHCHSWTWWIDSRKGNPSLCKAVIERVLKSQPSQQHCLALAHCKDEAGRVAINMAHADVQKLLFSYIFFCGRYELQQGPPIHRSATAVVMYALDYGVTAEYSDLYGKVIDAAVANRTASNELSLQGFSHALTLLDPSGARQAKANDLFASFDNNHSLGLSKEEFLQFCATIFGKERKVAIKFMRNEKQYRQEIFVRKHGKTDSSHPWLDHDKVVAIKETSDSIEQFASQVASITPYDRNSTPASLAEYVYGLVMPAADRSLDEINKKEEPDMVHIKTMMAEVAVAVKQCHDKKVTHGDLKMLNVVRVDNKLKLIDFDASVVLKKGNFLGAKFSSGNLPKEMFFELDGNSEEQYNAYWAHVRDNPEKRSQELWQKIKPAQIGEDDGFSDPPRKFVVRTYKIDIDGKAIEDGLPYPLVPASPAADFWAFGVMMYHLCTNGPLLLMKDDGDLISESVLQAANWTQTQIDTKIKTMTLARATDDGANVKSLLELLLCVDHVKRAALTWDEILAHAFFAGGGYNSGQLTAFVEGQAAISEGNKKILEMQEEAKQLALEARQLALESREMLDKILQNSVELTAIGLTTLTQIKQTEAILLKGMMEVGNVTVPSCFIVVPHLLRAEDFEDKPGKEAPSAALHWNDMADDSAEGDNDTEGEYDDDDAAIVATSSHEIQVKVQQSRSLIGSLCKIGRRCTQAVKGTYASVERIAEKALDVISKPGSIVAEAFQNNTQTVLYLYLINEVTHKPMFPKKGVNSKYPLEIAEPTKFATDFMPLMKISLKAMVVWNGVAGLAQCLGYPVPKIPASVCKSLKIAVGTLDQASSVAEYDVLQGQVDVAKVADGKSDTDKAEAAKAVRGKQLRDLQEFFLRSDPKGDFCGLRRVLMPDGSCVWASDEDVEKMQKDAEEELTKKWAVQGEADRGCGAGSGAAARFADITDRLREYGGMGLDQGEGAEHVGGKTRRRKSRRKWAQQKRNSRAASRRQKTRSSTP